MESTTTSLNTFTLEVPKNEVRLFKQITKKMGWRLRSRRNMSSYEKSLDDAANGRVNYYASSEDFFKKMGI